MESTSGVVSTIIPVHNRPNQLREAVESVVTQSYGKIEIIIVDDCSSDSTPETIAELKQKFSPRILACKTSSQSGPGAARQVGMGLAGGEFIQFLDSDDLLLPEKFELQVDSLRENQDAGVSYGYTRFQKPDGSFHPEPWKGSGIRRDIMFPSFLSERWWDTPNPLYRRSVCEEAGPWLPLWQEEDWEYDCRIAALGTRLVHVEQFVCVVRSHDKDRLSNSQLDSQQKLTSRASAQTDIYQSALKGNVDPGCAEFREFSKGLFLLARKCGAAGLNSESKALFDHARSASKLSGQPMLKIHMYGAIALLLGWNTAGKIANRLEQRQRRPR